MKNDQLRKHLAISFLAALGLYIAGFSWVEHRRSRLGPWNVTFIKAPGASLVLRIHQPGLKIGDVEIELAGNETDLTSTNAQLSFVPGQAVPFTVPFGECVFLDPTFLPGTVTLQILGHEIQMLPRTLTVDGREHAWNSGLRVAVPPFPPAEALP